MSLCRAGLLLCLLLLSVTGRAFAQDDPPVGLVMGVPVQAGILWHVTERVALRPDVSFSWSLSELGATSMPADVVYSSSVSSSRQSLGLAFLYYLGDDDGMRTYVAPRYRLSRASASTESAIVIPGIPDRSEDDRRLSQVTHSGGVSFGASYGLGDRFAVFGEVGFEFVTSSSPPLLDLESTSRALATTGGVGVVMYF